MTTMLHRNPDDSPFEQRIHRRGSTCCAVPAPPPRRWRRTMWACPSRTERRPAGWTGGRAGWKNSAALPPAPEPPPCRSSISSRSMSFPPPR
ncbi:hypothetical protein [Teichococcus aestuarii]